MSTDEDVQRRMDLADAALSLAGLQVTDPAVRSIARRMAADELEEDAGIAEIAAHLGVELQA